MAAQRTGSNALCGLLHGVKGIAMHNELFNQKGVFSHCGPANLLSLHDRNAAPGKFLLQALSIRDDGAVGFKCLPEHIRRSEASHALLSGVLADNRIKKIILKRENRLEVAVSLLRATTTGTYTHANLDNVPVALEPAQFQAFVDSYDAYYTYLAQATVGQHVLRVSYEDLCTNPLSVLKDICNFLGVPEPTSVPRHLFDKQTQEETRTAFDLVNWNALRAAFKHTERAVDFKVPTPSASIPWKQRLMTHRPVTHQTQVVGRYNSRVSGIFPK